MNTSTIRNFIIATITANTMMGPLAFGSGGFYAGIQGGYNHFSTGGGSHFDGKSSYGLIDRCSLSTKSNFHGGWAGFLAGANTFLENGHLLGIEGFYTYHLSSPSKKNIDFSHQGAAAYQHHVKTQVNLGHSLGLLGYWGVPLASTSSGLTFTPTIGVGIVLGQFTIKTQASTDENVKIRLSALKGEKKKNYWTPGIRLNVGMCIETNGPVTWRINASYDLYKKQSQSVTDSTMVAGLPASTQLTHTISPRVMTIGMGAIYRF